ncbi:MAG: biotin--[acetyl-CoA-carboxylase] ligase [Rhizobiaceae bacterium]
MVEAIGLIDELAGWRHLSLGDVGSTNSEAMRLAAEGDAGSLWVTAERQLRGRGRRGRPWVSEPGNLYASLLIVDPAPQAALMHLPLVAAVGVYDALKPSFLHAPQALAVKWPNDILVDGHKINGILLESASLPDNRMAVVIGCGVNCVHHPAQTSYPATNLAACGIDLPPPVLFPRLARAMAAALAMWKRGAGFHHIREKWLLAARGIGGRVTVNLGDGSVEGLFEDIDGDGYLRLRLDDGTRRKISAGDLFFAQ